MNPYILYCPKHASFGAHHKNLNEDVPILSAAEILFRGFSFWQYKIYANIGRGFPGQGASNDMGLSTTAIFSAFGSIFSETLEIRPTLLYSDMESLVGFLLTLKHVTLNDLQWPFYVLFLRQHIDLGRLWHANEYWWTHTISSANVQRVSGDIRFMRIFAGVILWRGDVKQQWVRALTHLLHMV